MQCHPVLILARRPLPSRTLPSRNPNASCVRGHHGRLPLWQSVLLILSLTCVPLAAHAGRFGGRAGGSGSLSALSCSSGSITGAGSDACTVSLSDAAGFRGLAVTLTSNNSAVTVPGSVTVQRGTMSASFTATVTSVAAPQSVTLTATANGASKTFALQVGAASTAIRLQSTSLAFGSVSLGTTATQSLVLTSSGTAPLTINAANVTGTGFTGPGASLPITLNPNQSATLELQFDPTTAGAATGSVTIASNASNSPTATVSLSGTGSSAGSYQVGLTWDAPSNSADPVAGYNIYRATSSGSYQLLNTSVNPPTSYTDNNVQSGATYKYEVMSVDAEGNESSPSNVYSATIP